MNSRLPLLVAAVAVYWQIAASLLVPEEDEGNGETARIVRGARAKRGQFPFAVAMYRGGSFTCTGSIISPDHVLTAAHCVSRGGEPADPESIEMVANVNRLAREQRIVVSEVMVHEEYDEDNIDNDIAILRMSSPFRWTDEVGPISLAESNPAEEDECRVATNYGRVYAMGWGSITPIPLVPILPRTLRYGEQKVICNGDCEGETVGIKETKLCATGKLRNSTAGWYSGVCNGDSGGPLVEERSDGTYRQIGITSYGVLLAGCGSPVPEVFTRNSEYKDWIEARTDRTASFV